MSPEGTSEMKEIYLPFTDENVRAAAEGRKTQTRRPIKGLPIGASFHSASTDGSILEFRYEGRSYFVDVPASPGDILGVKEALMKVDLGDETKYAAFRDGGYVMGDGSMCDWRWKRDVLPAIFMPHAHCRYKYELVDVRAELDGEVWVWVYDWGKR